MQTSTTRSVESGTVLYVAPRQGGTNTTGRSLRISDVARKLLIVTRNAWGL